MYNDISKELLDVLEPVVRAHGLELVDAPLARGARSRLTVVLDTPSGDGRVSIDDCTRVSRELGHALDAIGCIDGAYTLEVTSPGVDRTLGREVDFERAVGREVQVETREPLAGQRRFKGRLVAFEGGASRLETEQGPQEIPFAAIARARSFYPAEAGAGARSAAARGSRRSGRGAHASREG